ncbi:MAG TPA: hypothetical protein VFA04_14655 [Bryobacteraceae bacterium]|nr:hypothetical protein [Bryobacteraceae bacterium]
MQYLWAGVDGTLVEKRSPAIREPAVALRVSSVIESKIVKVAERRFSATESGGNSR